MEQFVGINVSSQKLVVCFMDSEDRILHEATLLKDITGASEIKDIALKPNEKLEYDVIEIGMESTSVYSFYPATFLA